jgi:hypothetical protein
MPAPRIDSGGATDQQQFRMLRQWRVPFGRWRRKNKQQTKGKIMQFEVRSEEVANIETEKGVWRPRRLMMLGAGDFAQQFIEINLPENCPQIGVGKKIDVYLRKAMRLNNGTLQVSGDLKAIDGKPFTLPPQSKAA